MQLCPIYFCCSFWDIIHAVLDLPENYMKASKVSQAQTAVAVVKEQAILEDIIAAALYMAES